MRHLLSVLLVLGVLAGLLAAVHPAPAYADQIMPGVRSDLVLTPGTGLDSLLAPSSDPSWHWSGLGTCGCPTPWPWWAGLPLSTISASTGFTWPWAPFYWTPWWWMFVALSGGH